MTPLNEKTQVQKQFFFNRLSKNAKHLKKWARKNNIGCFRVFDRDIPEIPLALDIYRITTENGTGDYVMMFLYERPYEKDENEERAWLLEMKAAASTCLNIPLENIIAAVRKRQRGSAQYKKNGEKPIEGIISEGGARFCVTLGAYIDTGIFLDHRILRGKIKDMACGKTVLNLFCYTASFSVFAALGGARAVDSVDLSKTSLERARRNFALNALIGNSADKNCACVRQRFSFIRADAVDFLRGAVHANRVWDIIILDPPTFSNSKKTREALDIRKDWSALVNLCLDALDENGALFFSTNSTKFRFEPQEVIQKTKRGYEVRVKDITRQTVSEDFSRKKTHQTRLFTVENN